MTTLSPSSHNSEGNLPTLCFSLIVYVLELGISTVFKFPSLLLYQIWATHDLHDRRIMIRAGYDLLPMIRLWSQNKLKMEISS